MLEARLDIRQIQHLSQCCARKESVRLINAMQITQLNATIARPDTSCVMIMFDDDDLVQSVFKPGASASLCTRWRIEQFKHIPSPTGVCIKQGDFPSTADLRGFECIDRAAIKAQKSGCAPSQGDRESMCGTPPVHDGRESDRD